MTRKPQHIEVAEGEEYLHKAAWQVVKRQMVHAEAKPPGYVYNYLVAMVFAYHCLEGYLNYIGEKIAPDAWKDEKKLFSKTGLYSKLDAICKQCGIATPTRGERPYSTVNELKKLRDDMVHPKIHRSSSKTKFFVNKRPPLFPDTYLTSRVSQQKALRARDDVKCIADAIQAAALAHYPALRLDVSALEGIQAMRSASMQIEN